MLLWCGQWDLNPHDKSLVPKTSASAVPPCPHGNDFFQKAFGDLAKNCFPRADHTDRVYLESNAFRSGLNMLRIRSRLIAKRSRTGAFLCRRLRSKAAQRQCTLCIFKRLHAKAFSGNSSMAQLREAKKGNAQRLAKQDFLCLL